MNESLQLALTALGHAILNSLWQMGLLWLAVVLYTRFHKKISPSGLSTISFFALVTGFSVFVVTFLVSLLSPQVRFGLSLWLNGADFIYPVITSLAWVYIALFIIPLLKLSNGIKSVYHIKRHGLGKVPGYFKIFLLDAIQYLDIKRKVKIFTSSLIQSPLTAGFLKPVILLPVAMVNQLSTQQVEAIILHELAHIRRNDYLQNIITQVILTMLYFNPFAKMLARMQCTEREKSADKWVMQFEYNNRMYANTLLQLARANTTTANNLAIHISRKSAPLLERIEWILGSNKRNTLPLRRLIFSFAVTASVFAVCLLKGPVTAVSSMTPLPVPAAAPVVFNEFSARPEQGTVSETAEPILLMQKDEANNKNEQRETSTLTTKEAGKINAEPVEPVFVEEEAQPVAIFASHAAMVQPELSVKEEKKVQEVITATKKAVIELSWKIIDNALAETITADNKQALKEVYTKKIESSDWEKPADLLRLRYNEINWNEVNQQLAAVINEIKLDSIYTNCRNMVHELNNYKKQLKENTLSAKEKVDSINGQIRLYNITIQKLDSLRSKKIVEL